MNAEELALYKKIKPKIKRKAVGQCPQAPGELAIYVKRTDTGKGAPEVELDATGLTAAHGSTGGDGWIIFTDRKPGSYDARVVNRPPAFAKFKVKQERKTGTVPCSDTEVMLFELTPPPKVGVALSFHPVLFKKDEFPASVSDFYILRDPTEFVKKHLLADGESEAVISIRLVKLDERGNLVEKNKLTTATDAEHFNEGNVVLQLSSGDFGELSYGNQRGIKVSVPVKDIPKELPTDKTKWVLFKTSRKIGEATVTASIENNEQYESCALPGVWAKQSQVTLGSRTLVKDLLGYDARKVQWFLRKAGFVSYAEQKKDTDGPGCEWSKIKDISTDGGFGPGSALCLRDFQRVALGKFRSKTHKDVEVTLKAKSTDVTSEAISEFLEWRAMGYTVEPYNGVVVLKVTDGGVIDATARIVYGAVVDKDENTKGYIEITEPTIGKSECHWDGRALVIADEIRSGIKLFEKEVLKFRLHDADPGAPDSDTAVLDDENLNPKLAEKLKPTIRELRREQAAADSGADCRDVRLYEGYRSVARQESLFYKGRYRWTNAQGLQFKEHTPPNPAPAGMTHTEGERCTHGAETIPLGTCLVHRGGNPPGQPCQHGAETRPVGTCLEHQWGIGAQPCSHPAGESRKVGKCYAHPIGTKVTGARGESRSSWHQYGLAVDLVFNTPKGEASWPDAGNWARNGRAAKDRGLRWGGDWVDEKGNPDPDPPHIQVPQPPNDSPKNDPHRDKYNATNGSELDKLKAVWSLF